VLSIFTGEYAEESFSQHDGEEVLLNPEENVVIIDDINSSSGKHQNRSSFSASGREKGAN